MHCKGKIMTETEKSPALLIELSCEYVSMCDIEGSDVQESAYIDHVMDCNKPGDSQEACEYVLDHIGVDFRIVDLDESGKYINRLATAAEKAEMCKTIFSFDSATDFSDERTAEIYLVWEATSTI